MGAHQGLVRRHPAAARPETAASFGYRRHTDLFVLFVDQPSIYENNHITTSYEGALRRADTLRRNITLSYGLEADGDTIHTNNLGQHARNQGAGYANLNLTALGRFSLSVGAREEVLRSGNGAPSSPPPSPPPTPLTRSLRLRASVGHGFRLPTYLDLYYSDPTTIGNPNLQPESSWTYDGGFDWTPPAAASSSHATGFRLQEKDTIDYSKTDPRHSGPHLRRTLASHQHPQLPPHRRRSHLPPPPHPQPATPIRLHRRPGRPATAQHPLRVRLQLRRPERPLPSGQSCPQHSARLSAHTQVSRRPANHPTAYALCDLSLVRNTGLLRPYLRLLNLSNTSYQEIPHVPLQGRTIMAGAEFNWSTAPH